MINIYICTVRICTIASSYFIVSHKIELREAPHQRKEMLSHLFLHKVEPSRDAGPMASRLKQRPDGEIRP